MAITTETIVLGCSCLLQALTSVTSTQGFSLAGLNLRAERVNLRVEKMRSQSTSPEGRAL